MSLFLVFYRTFVYRLFLYLLVWYLNLLGFSLFLFGFNHRLLLTDFLLVHLLRATSSTLLFTSSAASKWLLVDSFKMFLQSLLLVINISVNSTLKFILTLIVFIRLLVVLSLFVLSFLVIKSLKKLRINIWDHDGCRCFLIGRYFRGGVRIKCPRIWIQVFCSSVFSLWFCVNFLLRSFYNFSRLPRQIFTGFIVVFDVWLSNPNLFCFVRLVCQLSLGLLGVFRSSRRSFDFFAFICGLHGLESVSYTHLTLPTKA